MPGPPLAAPSPALVAAICPRCSLSPAPHTHTPLASPSLTYLGSHSSVPSAPHVPGGSLPVALLALAPPLPLHTEGHPSLPGVPGPCPAALGTPHRMPPAPSSWQPHPLDRGSSSSVLSPPITEAGILRVTLAFLSSVSRYARSIRNGLDLRGPPMPPLSIPTARSAFRLPSSLAFLSHRRPIASHPHRPPAAFP